MWLINIKSLEMQYENFLCRVKTFHHRKSFLFLSKIFSLSQFSLSLSLSKYFQPLLISFSSHSAAYFPPKNTPLNIPESRAKSLHQECYQCVFSSTNIHTQILTGGGKRKTWEKFSVFRFFDFRACEDSRTRNKLGIFSLYLFLWRGKKEWERKYLYWIIDSNSSFFTSPKTDAFETRWMFAFKMEIW